MSFRQILRVLLISASAMIIAIILAQSWGMKIEGAVGLSALLTATVYEMEHPKSGT